MTSPRDADLHCSYTRRRRMQSTTIRQSVHEAARRPEVVEAVHSVYAALQSAIDVRRPRCEMSGRCCHFESYGHRLYVSTMELAAFVATTKAAPEANCQSCPFQRGKICSVHETRPFGCRIFFCDPTAEQWQREQYEQFHADLKRLHERLNVPYHYLEWRSALSELGLDRVSEAASSF